MIHYHGTPISGTRQEAARFLVGRHALIPFGRQDDLAAALENSQSFVLDNVAFSHWKRGNGRIDFAGYLQWAQKLCTHPCFDWALIPDIIDGSEVDNVEWVYLWLKTAGRCKGVPVYHLHESFEWLEWLVNNFDTVALGSSGKWSDPGTKRWWERMDEVMRIVCDGNGVPKCRLHGLRMLDPEIFTKLPLTSADSTNAAVNAGSLSRFGMYIPSTSSQRAAVIADRIETHNSSIFYSFSKQNELFELYGNV
jgi:hypothetical protein